MSAKKPVEIDKDAIQRDYTEALLKAGDFFKKNRIYCFRHPTEVEKPVMVAMDDPKLFMPPNPPQAKILEAWENPRYKVFTITGGNRLGKTTIECVMALSVMFGRTLWNDKPIPFGHKRARKVRWVGQGWESHIKAVIIPALKFWWPQCRPVETKKNNQGVEAIWKDVITGSTLEIMSNSQESDMFEGWEGDLLVYDEPPKRDIRVSCARGLIDRNGRELFGATLLKEAWIHREIIKARLSNGQVDDSVFNVYGQIYDNEGYGLTKEGIEQFAKSLKPEEKEARLYGKPSYMSSLVFPKFDRDIHLKKPFKIPLDWIVDLSIDFHPSKPWAVVFLATAKNNFKYVCKEMEIRGNPKFVGEEIIRYIREGNLRVGRATIDPLAKGDKNAHEEAQTVFDILSQTLCAANIMLDVASKDKDNGISLVNNLLWTENEMPGIYFFEDCVKTIQQVEDLMYDPESLKPTALKIEDDFTECLYRLALLNTQWFSEVNFSVSEQRSMML
jgi:hypothetical protein